MPMIGKPLSQRHVLGPLPAERAAAIMTEALASLAEQVVQVRARDARMVACVVVRADEASVRLCRTLGFEWKPGGTGVFGLEGADAARVLPELSPEQRAWLSAPCGPRETKVFLVAGGRALLSLEVNDGKVAITHGP